MLAVFGARFRLLLQYRAAALAGLFTQICFGLVITATLRAYYANATGPQLLSLEEVMSYVWLGQALLLLLPWRMDGEVKAMIQTGGIAYELLKPVDLFTWWFARGVALRTAPMLLRAVPMLVLAFLLFGLKAPATTEAALLWVLALAGAVALSAMFTVWMNISMLWTLSGEGMQFLMPAMSSLLSGHVVPLPLLPNWARTTVEWLPFRGLLDTPHRIWLGDLAGAEAWGALAHQWVWVLALGLVGRAILGHGLKRVVVQGG